MFTYHSGKTTLLNTLATRKTGTSQTGTLLYNSKSPSTYVSTGRIAYVQQTDALLPYLTVRETLLYAARLRLPPSLSHARKTMLVDSVIAELGLVECAHTIVGNEWRKGISGGEKRRVSVGVQLLLNPSLLFVRLILSFHTLSSSHSYMPPLFAFVQ